MATSLPPDVDLAESKIPQLQGTIISTWILAVIIVALRFQSRGLSKIKPWWDDWAVLFALVIFNIKILKSYIKMKVEALTISLQILGSVANIIPLVWSMATHLIYVYDRKHISCRLPISWSPSKQWYRTGLENTSMSHRLTPWCSFSKHCLLVRWPSSRHLLHLKFQFFFFIGGYSIRNVMWP